MFDHYTEEAGRAVFVARWEAGAEGAPAIAGEHLLLGLLRADEGIEKALPSPAAARRIRERVEQKYAGGEKLPTSVDMPVSEDCQRVFEEAAKLNHPLIGTEQLLIAILHQEKCLAAQILLEQGFELEKFRSQPAPLNQFDFE